MVKKRRVLPPLPCGCPIVMQTEKGGRYGRMHMLDDGTRLCPCGKMWRLSWERVTRIEEVSPGPAPAGVDPGNLPPDGPSS